MTKSNIWVVRTGSKDEPGEPDSRDDKYLPRFLKDSRIYLTWNELPDLSSIKSKEELKALVIARYHDSSKGRQQNWQGQFWGFRHQMEQGDFVFVASSMKKLYHLAQITSDYKYDAEISTDTHYRHYRTVRWLQHDVSRESIKKQIPPNTKLSKGIMPFIGRPPTIFQVNNEEAQKRLLRVIDTIRT